MEGLLTTVSSYVSAAMPILEWILFFVLLFALLGIGVRFYSFFNTRNFTYYQPSQRNVYQRRAVQQQSASARMGKKTVARATVKGRRQASKRKRSS